MDSFVTGDVVADEDIRKRGGWFLGYFMDAGNIRKSDDVEIKWGIHPAGERNNGGFVANKIAKTMSILISGRFRIVFRETEKTQILRSS